MTGKNSKQSKSEPRQLPANYKLGRFDVICARGKLAQEHEGNIRMKALVQSCLPQYAESSCKVTKSRIVSSIVDAVREASPEGGFLKFVDDGWVCVNDRFAREKVGQQFRDLLHNKYRSSTKAKARARTMQQQGTPDMMAANMAQLPLPPITASTPMPLKGAATNMLASFNKNSAEPSLVSSALATHNTNSLAAQLSFCHQQEIFQSGPQPLPVASSSTNFLGQLIQRLDRSSEGAHADFEKHMTMKAPASSAIPHPGHPSTNWAHMPSAESSAILSDLEPTPMKELEDLRSSSAIFSIDAFLWEPRC